MHKRFQLFRALSAGQRQRLAVMTIFIVAAQILPSEARDRKLPYVPVGRMVPPLDIQYGVTSSTPRLD